MFQIGLILVIGVLSVFFGAQMRNSDYNNNH